MNGFKDFLIDYEMKEKEEINKHLKKFTNGENERYPPLSRFVKAKEPLAEINSIIPVWGVIPFYGSTVLPLSAASDKKVFDELYSEHGFTSRDIDRLIDFVKETGRLQFVISPPTEFQNMDFLRPLLEELRPPMDAMPLPKFLGPRKYREYLTEFRTLADLGLTQLTAKSELVKLGLMKEFNDTIANRYAVIRAIGNRELVDDIRDSMVTDPSHATKLIIAASHLYIPAVHPLRATSNFSLEAMVKIKSTVGKYHLKTPDHALYEIGKFILEKMIHYPTTLDGCMETIQYYQNYELLKVSGALDEGVRKRKIDVVQKNTEKLSTILDNVWKDASGLKRRKEILSYGISAGIGLIGELASIVPGVGILSALGFQALDRFTEAKVSERFAKFVSPNYLITIYDFRQKLESH